MHDLARCAVSAGERVLDGYVTACASGTMIIGVETMRHVTTFRVGDDVQVLVLDEVRGQVAYQGRVARVGATTVQVAELELTSMLQKRGAVRVRLAQRCAGVVQSAQEEPRITFVLLDISAHGMRISTTAELAEHERIAFLFPTHDGVVPLVAEVLRSHRITSTTTQCGCRFVGLGEREMDLLFRFVLQTQGAQLRSRLRS